LGPEGAAALAGIALGELVAVVFGTGLYGVLERERSARAALAATQARLHPDEREALARRSPNSACTRRTAGSDTPRAGATGGSKCAPYR
jgi:hypothetical protein